MFEIDVELEPEELVAAWRPDAGRLVLPVERVPDLHERTVARLRLRGHPSTTLVVGSPVWVYDSRSEHQLHLAPDEGSLGALRRLHALATGASAAIEPRRPRYLASVPVIIEQAGEELLMSTTTVSLGGCGLAWSGSAPAIGRPLRLWLGDRLPLVGFHGLICWRSPEQRPVSAGLTLVPDDPTDQAIWTRFVSSVEGAGALRQ